MAPRSPDRLLPPLLPATRWGRVALLLLVLFALARSVMWASAQPGWLAPDEDYHWNYVEHILVEKTLPDLDKPFATSELYTAALTVQQGQYLPGPRTRYEGDPHASVARMKELGGKREATGEPPRPVLHPPLYHLGATLVDRAVTNAAAVTRLTAMRYYSAAIGAFCIWLVWLLASQVLARLWEQLAAAALVATQPIAAFSASTLTNDVLTLGSLTAALVWCARALRRPPRPVDGLVLGALLAVAVLTKATLLATIPLAALTLLMTWRTFRLRLGSVARLVAGAAVVFLAGTAWWWRIVLPETHSLLGARVSVTSAPAPTEAAAAHAPGVLSVAFQWLSSVYRSYWFDYQGYEVAARGFWYHLPLVVGCLALAALLALAFSVRRTLFDPERPILRHVVLLVAAALVLLLPPLWFDVRNGLAGHAFTVQQGRFLVPAYPAAAVLLVLAASHLLRRVPVARAVVIGGVVALAFVNYCHTWVHWCLEHFYGPVHGDWLAAFRRASFDKPEWIGPGWFAVVAGVALAAFIAAYVTTAVGALRGRHATEPAAPRAARARSTAPMQAAAADRR